MTSSQVRLINCQDLQQRLEGEGVGLLLDVREEWEHSLAAIPGSVNIPLAQLVDRLQELAFEDDIVVYCHVGQRSFQAAQILVESGFPGVFNLVGGIDAWSQVIDPSIRRYQTPF
ncbi:MAG: rhodanese [Nitrospinaceae bacterium]|nr:rhodanese [Nitrospinaceae bacterium]NIR53566.1 rhodanese [Nitrospinaceae bacterium]NIS83967.1 rhodanese [Nitrospinaceae bacterium]NIT80776.1 rhodanese [Nitrospinaceae bacterium]NIU43082.1 rhodanese [Nitrospinaceae bacterium]